MPGHKHLRPCFLYDRRLLGVLSRVAYDTWRHFMRATLRLDRRDGAGDDDLHLPVTDGAFRPDGIS